MAYDVFLSHSAKDKPTADAVCAVLEKAGIRCWIAPRDIVPGSDWGSSILQAIRNARVMVLVFSSSANESEPIKREVERAVNRGIPIIPLRIEDVRPADALEFFLSTPHWLDAYTPPLERHLAYLTEVIQKILGAPSAPPESPSNEAAPSKATISDRATETTGAKTLAVPAKFPTIQSALNSARPGQVVRVSAGEYAESLRFVEGVSLVGEGRDLVKVRAPATANALLCLGIKKGMISGITFEHIDKNDDPDNRPSVVKLCNGCSVEISDCRIQSGNGGGIFISSKSAPTISECIVQNNWGHGITIVEAHTSASILGNHVRGNGHAGIRCTDGTSCRIEGNVCESNKEEGIGIGGKGTKAILATNHCRNNGDHGIQSWGGASGEMRENTCESNRACGIDISQAHTNFVLKANLCRSNTLDGIRIMKESASDASDNFCENNKGCGIFVKGAAANLRANFCRANDERGILFYERASGLAEENACDYNTLSGISVMGADTSILLKSNRCRNSGTHGVFFGEGAAGEAQGNVCEENRGSGIYVRDAGTNPRIVSNTCQGNGEYGIWCDLNSHPALENNQVIDNATGSVVTDGQTPVAVP